MAHHTPRPDSSNFRKEVAECAKNFKAHWITMGRFVYAVHTEKLYRSWGFQEFDAYCVKEIGIKPQTALKLLKSYYFLEKEEPAYVKAERFQGEDAPRVPDYESVNLLRLAKGRKIEEEDYDNLKKQVLDEGAPLETVRKEYKKVLEAKEPLSVEERETERQRTVLRRYLSTLKSLQKEVIGSRHMKKKHLVQIDAIIKDLEEEMS